MLPEPELQFSDKFVFWLQSNCSEVHLEMDRDHIRSDALRLAVIAECNCCLLTCQDERHRGEKHNWVPFKQTKHYISESTLEAYSLYLEDTYLTYCSVGDCTIFAGIEQRHSKSTKGTQL